MISFAVCRCCGFLRFGGGGLTLRAVAMLFMGVSSLAVAFACPLAKRRHGTCRTPRGERGGSKRKGLRAKLFGGTAQSVGEPKPVGRMALQSARGSAP